MQATVEAPAQAPAPTPAPAIAAPVIPQLVFKDGTSPEAVYRGYQDKGGVLREQLKGLVDQRDEEISGLRQMSGGDMAGARSVVQERISRLDKRIAGIEEQIAQNDGQVASAAAIPGAIPRQEPNSGGGDEEEAYFGGLSTAGVIILLYVIYRRIFRGRRGKKAGGTEAMKGLPAEVSSRLERLEGIAESTALEVERIGEGQRFVTKLLSETARAGPVGVPRTDQRS